MSHPAQTSNKLNSLQIYLHHCKLASFSLTQVITDLNIDLVLMQERFAFSSK